MTIVNHLSLDQLQQRIKQEKDPIAQLRFLAVYHAQRGLGAREIAQLTTRTPAGCTPLCNAITSKAHKP